jgi:hypothetical protein
MFVTLVQLLHIIYYTKAHMFDQPFSFVVKNANTHTHTFDQATHVVDWTLNKPVPDGCFKVLIILLPLPSRLDAACMVLNASELQTFAFTGTTTAWSYRWPSASGVSSSRIWPQVRQDGPVCCAPHGTVLCILCTCTFLCLHGHTHIAA